MIIRSSDRRKLAPASRSGGLYPLIGAVVLLLAGAFGIGHARTAHREAAGQLAAADAALSEARSRETLVRNNGVLLAAIDGLNQHAQGAAVLPRYWAARQINLRQQNMSREQANQMLLGTARSNGQLLKLEEFDLSVTQADEGLFDGAAGARQPVLLTLRGVTHFRIAGKLP